MVTEKQKANLIPFSERSKKEARELGRIGGQKSGETRNWKARLQKCVGDNWECEIPDEKMKAQLQRAGLPPTYFGQFIFNIVQRGSKNPLMLKTLLEAMDIVTPNQNNVTVNATPIIIGNEDELAD